ncbi:MAG: hypothetical protein ACRDWD_11590 [Acidimicrobiia bacterium]
MGIFRWLRRSKDPVERGVLLKSTVESLELSNREVLSAYEQLDGGCLPG